MFATAEGVRRLTGYQVEAREVFWAQQIIEAYIGRTEDDIRDRRDRSILERAVVFQTVYMHNNKELAYEQIALRQYGQNESIAIFDNDRGSPFLAPLAYEAIQKLSWKRARSVRTGSTFGNLWGRKGHLVTWWSD